LWLTACVASHTEAPTALRPAPDRLLTAGDIQVAEGHLKDFGFDPGPADGIFTAQTQEAVQAFQTRFGLPVSGLLDRATREELNPWSRPPADRLAGVGGVSVCSIMTLALRRVSSDTPAACASSGGVIVLGRTYVVQYTDGRGQAQTERGRLVALDQEGFVVLEVNGKRVLIPKARVDALVEVG
jgi:peptidoglycan hydrolase-like protein with peptidoglycan-binding domain